MPALSKLWERSVFTTPLCTRINLIFGPFPIKYMLLEKAPSGADYSEIRFYDEKMIPCKKQNATQCVIVEKMNDETIVRTTYGFVENKIE